MISSWSKDYEQAFKFAKKKVNTGKNMYRVVMEAEVSENVGKLLDCEGLYSVDFLGKYSDEAEVFAFGNVDISKIMWEYAE